MAIVQLHVLKNKTIKDSTGIYYVLWSLLFFLALSCSNGEDTNKSTTKSDNLEVAIHEIQLMDSCRVKARNRDFYLHKYKAEKIISRYYNDNDLNGYERSLFTKAQSSFAFARTDYFMQVGKYKEARAVMEALTSDANLNLYSDTTQWLNFLYHQGKVNYHPYNILRNKRPILQGYDSIVQCYILSSRADYLLYEALSMQVLSIYLLNDSIFSLANEVDMASIRYINEDSTPDSLLAADLAERSLDIFLKLNKPYYTANAWLTLARCYFKQGEAQRSVECLDNALSVAEIDSMPDLRASINEQMSLSYAALDNKRLSDFFRNEYLDLQDSTRQDRELEARVMALQTSTTKIWWLVIIAFAVFVVLCVTTIVLTHIRRRKESGVQAENEMLEQQEEEFHLWQLRYSDAIRSAVEQKARIAVVSGMVSLIDRMKHAVIKGDTHYAYELVEEIERQNTMLTQWIKLRKGIIQPRIESFPLQSVFDIISRNKTLLNRYGIILDMSTTDTIVKGDTTLTLFILNTLIDNARKAVDSTDGCIKVMCVPNVTDRYAEISVSDNGKGMEPGQVEHLFEYKKIIDISDSTSHGFGLVNCRGIIDRYRKISSLFSVCDIFAQSVAGKGTTVSFRLPLVIKTLLLFMTLGLVNAASCFAGNVDKELSDREKEAAAYCDSLYQCNIDGRYAKAMLYADSCHAIVRQDTTIDVGIRLSLYNETAIAALALHQWDTYVYYNYLFTNLYKEYTADASLPSYCETMERNRQKANIAMLIVLLLIVSLVPVFWYAYLRHLLRFHKGIREKKQYLKEQTRKLVMECDHLHLINNIQDNQLSALKHETMYYPVRIKQLISAGDDADDLQATVKYYSELYGMLGMQAMGRLTAACSFLVEKILLTDVFKHIAVNGNVASITVIANRELMVYLGVLLRRNNGGRIPQCAITLSVDKYVTLTFTMAANRRLAAYANDLFTSSTPNIDFLVMRQIVRETGSASLHYGAGISAEVREGVACISIILPKQG